MRGPSAPFDPAAHQRGAGERAVDVVGTEVVLEGVPVELSILLQRNELGARRPHAALEHEVRPRPLAHQIAPRLIRVPVSRLEAAAERAGRRLRY